MCVPGVREQSSGGGGGSGWGGGGEDVLWEGMGLSFEMFKLKVNPCAEFFCVCFVNRKEDLGLSWRSCTCILKYVV